MLMEAKESRGYSHPHIKSTNEIRCNYALMTQQIENSAYYHGVTHTYNKSDIISMIEMLLETVG